MTAGNPWLRSSWMPECLSSKLSTIIRFSTKWWVSEIHWQYLQSVGDGRTRKGRRMDPVAQDLAEIVTGPISRRHSMGRYLVTIFGIYTRDEEVLDYIPSPWFGIVFRA
jgi:hypothetical protein